MLKKTAADGQWAVSARFQLLQEVLTVEVPQFLHISKNDAAFPSQVLRQVQTLHLREVVLNDVAEGAHILPLRGDHLIHDVLHFTDEYVWHGVKWSEYFWMTFHCHQS